MTNNIQKLQGDLVYFQRLLDEERNVDMRRIIREEIRKIEELILRLMREERERLAEGNRNMEAHLALIKAKKKE